MNKVVTVLKEEIRRLARKESKTIGSPARKAAAKLRTFVAALKRQVGSLQKEVAQLRAALEQVQSAVPETPAAGEEADIRITAKGMKSLRRRLNLSGDELGKLLGVTGQAVYHWEKLNGALRLRETTRAKILTVRKIGARDARRLLVELPKAPKPARKASRKRGNRPRKKA